MANREKWLKQRCGFLSASMLSEITSKSGKIIDGNLSAIRKKRFERRFGFSLPVTSKAMEIGVETEPYIIEWFRNQYPDMPIVYSQEEKEIPFWTVDWAKFGASPDAYTPDERIVIECKTVVSNTNIEFFSDIYTSYEEKLKAVWDEHGDQILGQFLSNPKVEQIWVVKYIPQNDEIMEDRDSPLDVWRGSVFVFKREDYTESIEAMKQRILLFDAMIDSHINPSEFKEGIWYLDEEFCLKHKEKEKDEKKNKR